MKATDWYYIPLVERTWKVAAMMLPDITATLDMRNTSKGS